MYSINSNVCIKQVNDGAVLLDLGSGEYFSLNDVGYHIWHLIEQQQSMEEILSSLLDEFQVSEEDARRDLEDFVSALEEKNILKVEK